MSRWHPQALVGGVFFLLVGTLFLLDGLGTLRLRPAHLWPLLLIGAGAAILAGAGRPER